MVALSQTSQQHSYITYEDISRLDINDKMKSIVTRTIKTLEYMNFGFFVDYEGNYFDTTHFASSLKSYPFQGHGVYLLKGKIVEEFGHCSMEVTQMARMPLQEKEE